MDQQKTKKQRMKAAGQGLIATGVGLGFGAAYSGEMLIAVPMAIFIFFGVMLYMTSRMEAEEEE